MNMSKRISLDLHDCRALTVMHFTPAHLDVVKASRSHIMYRQLSG